MSNFEKYAAAHELDPAQAGEVVLAAATTDARGNFGILLFRKDLEDVGIQGGDSKEQVIEKIRQAHGEDGVKRLVSVMFNEDAKNNAELCDYARDLLRKVLDWVEVV